MFDDCGFNGFFGNLEWVKYFWVGIYWHIENVHLRKPWSRSNEWLVGSRGIYLFLSFLLRCLGLCNVGSVFRNIFYISLHWLRFSFISLCRFWWNSNDLNIIVKIIVSYKSDNQNDLMLETYYSFRWSCILCWISIFGWGIRGGSTLLQTRGHGSRFVM